MSRGEYYLNDDAHNRIDRAAGLGTPQERRDALKAILAANRKAQTLIDSILDDEERIDAFLETGRVPLE